MYDTDLTGRKTAQTSLLQIYLAFFKLGGVSFGGGYAMVPLIEHEVVTKNQWVEQEQIVDILAVAGSLPGAIGLNASVLVGYHVAGIRGALSSVLGSLCPSLIIVLTLCVLFERFNSYPAVQAAFLGIRPAVISLIVFAAYKMSKTAIKDRIGIIIALLTFCGMTFVHPILLIIVGGFAGLGVTYMKDAISARKEGK